MTLHTHTCAATGCQHQIPAHLLMCMDHWRMVPVVLRRAVMTTYRDWKRLHSALAGRDYHEAVANAVAALAAKQHHKINERTAVMGDLFALCTPAGHEQLLKEEHGNTTPTEPGRGNTVGHSSQRAEFPSGLHGPGIALGAEARGRQGDFQKPGRTG
nr:hypothetical protein [uncultured Albidiferax sp.]